VLECKGVHHWFGPKRVLHDVNLRVVRGEVVGLVGPSGCGKSTLLRAILGTHPPRQGDVLVYSGQAGALVSARVTRPGRDRGIVYQRYSLFPNLTAIENVAFGLMVDQTGIPFRLVRQVAWRRLRKRHLAEAAEMLARVGLARSLDSYPHELSGGMCQRVAIAQALILKPAILLLDEPFGALDEATREDLQRMVMGLYAENLKAAEQKQQPPHTILLVTHDLNEAIYVSDRVVGLSQYWNWKADGHAEFPGATIVYDRVAPVFHPEDPKEHEAFARQKEEILKAVFDPESNARREEWNRFWHEVTAGEGRGVLKT